MNVPIFRRTMSCRRSRAALRPIFLADEPFGLRRRYCSITPRCRTGRNITMPRAQYFVTRRNGEWKVRAGYRYTGPYPTQGEALQAAIDFAERDGQAGREAQVLVQGEDRVFLPAWTYGRDPYPIEPRESADSKLTAGSAKPG
jgi:hypothetical protein